jgi:hypothetical protein
MPQLHYANAVLGRSALVRGVAVTPEVVTTAGAVTWATMRRPGQCKRTTDNEPDSHSRYTTPGLSPSSVIGSEMYERFVSD